MILDPETQALFEQLKFSCRVKVIRMDKTRFIGTRWRHHAETKATCWQPEILGDSTSIANWLETLPIEQPYVRPQKTNENLRQEISDLAEIMKGL